MTTVASLRLPADGFLLESAFRALPDAEFEVTPVVAHGGDTASLLHAIGVDESAARAALGDDPSVERRESVARTSPGALFRMRWAPRRRRLLESFTESGGTVLSLFGSDAEWHLRTLFPDRELLSQVYRRLEANDVAVRVDRVSELESTDRYGRYGLSDRQYTTLVTGFRQGYYGVPRDVGTSELAADLGITHQALSERLRRAHGTLVEHALLSGTRAFD